MILEVYVAYGMIWHLVFYQSLVKEGGGMMYPTIPRPPQPR